MNTTTFTQEVLGAGLGADAVLSASDPVWMIFFVISIFLGEDY